MFKGSKLKLTGCIAGGSGLAAASSPQRVTVKEEESVEDSEDLVLTSSGAGDIVTVESDTSEDAEPVHSGTTAASSAATPIPTRGRKKSRMVAFPFLD